MSPRIDPEQLWLGACVGAQLLVVFICVIKGNAYRDRQLLLHAAASLMGVLTVQTLIGSQPLIPHAVFLLVPALAGLQLLDLMAHAGALRAARRWLLAVTAGALPLLALASVYHVGFAIGALVLWFATAAALLWRAWPQSQPWAWWLLPAAVALAVAGVVVIQMEGRPGLEDGLLLAVLLVVWTACVYIATSWRGRIQGETRARIHARNTVDPLTGLATPMVLAERVQAARLMTKRYGHPSVLMVVHIENLRALAEEFGPEAAESAVLVAASRVHDALLRDGDVAARLTHARIGVLAEGAAPGQAAAAVATRVLVAGLKEPLPATPAEYLRFRIVLAAIPVEGISPKQLLHRLNARLDREVKDGSERRIVTLSQDELLVRTDFHSLAPNHGTGPDHI